MYFLFSGEGPTDLGMGLAVAEISEGNDFQPGPLAVLVEQLVEARHNYRLLEATACGYVTEQRLVERAQELKIARKPGLPGLKRQKETRYYFNNARALARIARECAARKQIEVVAILFRDADGTASHGRGDWDAKLASMAHGFEEETFNRGVPMIPKPKSEAWLLCGLREDSALTCEDLEHRSGNDRSPHSLKQELESQLGERPTRELLCQLIRTGRINVERITLPSYLRFRERLHLVC